jgi:hypothetical protein
MPLAPNFQQEVMEFDRVRSEITVMVSAQTKRIIHRPTHRFLSAPVHMGAIGALPKTILAAVLIPMPDRLGKVNIAGFSLNPHDPSLPAI